MKVKEALVIVSLILGIIADLLSIFGWFGITPENAGEATYQMLHTAAPFVITVISIFVGWQAREWSMIRSKKRKIERNLQDFKNDPCGEKKAMAAVIYSFPEHSVPVNERGVVELKDLEERGSSGKWITFFDFDARGSGVTYVDLQKWIVELFDAKPELIKRFPEDTVRECKELLLECEPF